MDFDLGDLVGGVADGIASSAASSSMNGKDNDGCGVFMAIFGVLGVIGLLVGGIVHQCSPEKEPPKPAQKVQQATERETVSHWLGRKAKDSALEFGKGLIGK